MLSTRRAALLLPALLLPACLSDLDFDSIEPSCEAPRFDAAAYDQYCSGVAETLEPITLPEGAFGHALYLGSDASKTFIAYGKPPNLGAFGVTSDTDPAPIFSEVELQLFDTPETDATRGAAALKLTFTPPNSDDFIFYIPEILRPFDAMNLLALNTGNTLALADMDAEDIELLPDKRRLPALYTNSSDSAGSFLDIAAFEGRSSNRRVIVAAAGAGIKLLYLEQAGASWSEDVPTLSEGDASSLYLTPCVGTCQVAENTCMGTCTGVGDRRDRCMMACAETRTTCIDTCKADTRACDQCGARLAVDMRESATTLTPHPTLDLLYVCGYGTCITLKRSALDVWSAPNAVSQIADARDAASRIVLPTSADDTTAQVFYIPLRSVVLGDHLYLAAARFPIGGEEPAPLFSPSQVVLLALKLDPATGVFERVVSQTMLPSSEASAFSFELAVTGPDQLTVVVHKDHLATLTSAEGTTQLPYFRDAESFAVDVTEPARPVVRHTLLTEGGLPNQLGIAVQPDGGTYLLSGADAVGSRVVIEGAPLP